LNALRVTQPATYFYFEITLRVAGWVTRNAFELSNASGYTTRNDDHDRKKTATTAVLCRQYPISFTQISNETYNKPYLCFN